MVNLFWYESLLSGCRWSWPVNDDDFADALHKFGAQLSAQFGTGLLPSDPVTVLQSYFNEFVTLQRLIGFGKYGRAQALGADQNNGF